MDKPMASDDSAKLIQDCFGLIVHSYNNYLSAMMGFTELARLECEEPQAGLASIDDKLALALESGDQAVVFGKELLSAASRLQVRMQPLKLAPFLATFCQQQALISHPADSTLGHLLEIQTDEPWFSFCLSKLVNFCRAICPEWSPKLDLVADSKKVTIYVTIAELSLSDEQQQHLFAPFYSSRHLLRQKDVGLAVVYGFVTQMKGQMQFTCGKGFCIELPCTGGYSPPLEGVAGAA